MKTITVKSDEDLEKLLTDIVNRLYAVEKLADTMDAEIDFLTDHVFERPESMDS